MRASSVGAMDLLDEESHRLLLWAVRLDEVGAATSRKELRRLAEPRRPAGSTVIAGLAGRPADFTEGPIASLTRRGLLRTAEDGGVAPTDLGRQVISSLGSHPEDAPLFEVLESDLRSSDPLAFARVVGRIAALDRPMVVDPYCRRPQLEYLVAHTTVTKVLVSDRLSATDLDDLSTFVRSLRRRDQRLRLRVAPADAVHDRHVIAGDRVLQVGGLAVATGGGSTILTEPVDLGAAAREYYRGVWKRARKLASYKPRSETSERAA